MANYSVTSNVRPDSTCYICYGEFDDRTNPPMQHEGREGVLHEFGHKKCLSDWFFSRPDDSMCPYCKKTINISSILSWTQRLKARLVKPLVATALSGAISVVVQRVSGAILQIPASTPSFLRNCSSVIFGFGMKAEDGNFLQLMSAGIGASLIASIRDFGVDGLFFQDHTISILANSIIIPLGGWMAAKMMNHNGFLSQFSHSIFLGFMVGSWGNGDQSGYAPMVIAAVSSGLNARFN